MVDPFPPLVQEQVKYGGQDRNPAVQLFGRRFFADQTIAELLVELLLVIASRKRIGTDQMPVDCVLPPMAVLREWPQGQSLKYAPSARLNLKLFAFLGASKLDTRHVTHRQHYRQLLSALSAPDRLAVSGTADRIEVLRTLENLFLGFQGVGGSRTWCAQTFVPFCREVLAAETLWNETQASRDGVDSWTEVASRFLHFFSLGRHRFLARGGELLYLQICNALRQPLQNIDAWCSEMGVPLGPEERDPEVLHGALEEAITSLLSACPETVRKLATFIDSGVEKETAVRTDYDGGTPRFTACGWCPTESWQEGLLFAVELLRLCRAAIDPIERLDLMETACAMQLLRSLCAQSARNTDWALQRPQNAGALGFAWVLSDPEGRNTVLKQISRRSVNAVQRMIHDALRHPDILDVLAEQKRQDEANGRAWDEGRVYREADGRYGHKLFLTVAKRIGLIVPKRGAGARFVLNDRILRCAVLSLVPPGRRLTYDTFKRLLFLHFGIAVDDDRIGGACEWAGTRRLSTLGGNTDEWLVSMLDAAGMLIRLSDSCSLVTNPFDGGGDAS